MKKLSALLMIFLTLAQSFGATYYVNATGGNDSRTTTEAQDPSTPWLTVGKARDNAVDGDTVAVFPGTYAEQLTFSADGTLGSYITYKATNGTPTYTRTWTITGDYTRFIGFKYDGGHVNTFGRDGFFLNGCVGAEIWRCTFTNMYRGGITMANTAPDTPPSRTVFMASDVGGTHGVEIGNDLHLYHVCGNDHLIAYNYLHHPNVDVNGFFMGGNNRVERNSIYGMNPSSPGHTDREQTSSGAFSILYFTNNTFTANFMVNTNGPDAHVNNMEDPGTTRFNRWRRNITYGSGSGTYGILGAWTNSYLIHDTIYKANRNATYNTTRYGTFWDETINARLYNNGFVNVWGASVSNPQVYDILTTGTGQLHNGNGAWDVTNPTPSWSAPFTTQTNEVTGDPLIVSGDTLDFRLGGGSAWIDTAQVLTRVTSSSGTGTSFVVTDSGFFVGDNSNMAAYGGALVKGDTITVGTDVLEISSIDYSTHTITVTASFTWAQGDAVYYGSDATPDIGALPASAVLLTGATFNPNTGVVTAVGDAALVVQFRAGAPLAADNAVPFSFTYQSGDEFLVFPENPQAVAYVVATAETVATGGIIQGAGAVRGAGIIR